MRGGADFGNYRVTLSGLLSQSTKSHHGDAIGATMRSMNAPSDPVRRHRTAVAFSRSLPARTSLLLLLLLGACLGRPAWSQSLEIIELHHRTAADVLPVLQPLLEPGGALSGQDYQLFARVSKANLAQLRQALVAIDQAQRQLVIAVRNSTRQQIEREHASLRGQIGPAQGSVSVQATQSDDQRAGDGVATVRVVEGGTASIANGRSVPIVTAFAVGGGRRPYAAGALEYRDVSSGYLVTPRLAGEHVTLQIDQQSQQPTDGRGGVATQSLSTQVSGRLGDWIALGGISESSSATSNTPGGRSYQTQSDERTLWVKVDLAN